MDSIFQVTENTWFDPHCTPTLELADLSETLNRRAMMQTVAKRVARCRVLIITLGLIEVWRDSKTGVYTEFHPDSFSVEARAQSLRVSRHQLRRNSESLEDIHALLTRFGHPDLRILITVSPVPLMATFSKMDVVVANSYGKSLLRAVAQEWAAAHQNVDYFPSYEIVQNSNREMAWETDLRHVTGPAVEHIMDLFIREYIE